MYLYYPSGAVRNIIIKRNGKEVDPNYTSKIENHLIMMGVRK